MILWYPYFDKIGFSIEVWIAEFDRIFFQEKSDSSGEIDFSHLDCMYTVDTDWQMDNNKLF